MKCRKLRTESKKPSKQRSALFNAPLHAKHAMVACHLSDDLRKKWGTRSLPVRKGDTVKVMRGDSKGTEGKVSRVDLKSTAVNIEGLTQKKVGGASVFTPIHPSNLLLTKVSVDDKRRRTALERAKAAKASGAE